MHAGVTGKKTSRRLCDATDDDGARELGGANYLVELANFSSPTKFDRYVDMMREAWKNREKNKILIQAKEEIGKLGRFNKRSRS